MSLLAKIELFLSENHDFQSRPDSVEFTFYGALIAKIASARVMLALDVLGPGADVRLSLPDAARFLADDYDEKGEIVEVEYFEDEEDDCFRVASGWLSVEATRLGFVWWEDSSDAELSGFIELPDYPALRDAIEQAMPAALANLREQLARKVLGG